MKNILFVMALSLLSGAAWAGIEVSGPTQPTNTMYRGYNFGIVPVNFLRAVDFTITANGNAPTQIQGIWWWGMPAYTTTTNCMSLLQPGQRCIVRVSFLPRARAFYQGRVQINADQEQFILNLTGWGR
jgi:hypothetical protein